jgi:hypothetical protein
MPRPFNRRQARENAAFIRLLGETGNVELAARECGLHKPTLYSRRKAHAAFAAEWDAAMIAARARIAARPREAARAGKGRWPDGAKAAPRFKTAGGEPRITRMKDGSLQLRLARAGGIGFRAEQAFLRALATCGNIAMAARAVGVAPRNIYARRERCRVFKGEMDAARRIASERLEAALHGRALAALRGEGADDVWQEEEFAALPAMTIDQAMMLLRLHRRHDLLGDGWGRLGARKRRGPLSSEEIGIERRIWWTREQERERADALRREAALRRADRYERTGNWFLPGEQIPEALGVERRATKRLR